MGNHDVKYHFRVHIYCTLGILVIVHVAHAFDGYFMEMQKKKSELLVVQRAD